MDQRVQIINKSKSYNRSGLRRPRAVVYRDKKNEWYRAYEKQREQKEVIDQVYEYDINKSEGINDWREEWWPDGQE